MTTIKIVSTIILTILPGGIILLALVYLKHRKSNKPKTANPKPSRGHPIGYTITREQDRKTSTEENFFISHQDQLLKKFNQPA